MPRQPTAKISEFAADMLGTLTGGLRLVGRRTIMAVGHGEPVQWTTTDQLALSDLPRDAVVQLTFSPGQAPLYPQWVPADLAIHVEVW